MKKRYAFLIIFIVLVVAGIIGFNVFSSTIVKKAYELENTRVDISKVSDGKYEGHSELGPVIVDVNVTVEAGKIVDVEIVRHDNGLGGKANAIAEDIVKANSYEVDAVSGATVSSKVIMNAVNNALNKATNY